jgi:hypothetical protein
VPAFVQVNSGTPQSSTVSSVAVTYTAVQTAGNLNVVIVGWKDTTASVASVTDTKGNVYTRAVGPTLGTGLTQSIYYAKNISSAAAGVNRVTVSFSPSAAFPDVRILEYSGIDPVTPVDATSAGVGKTITSNSGLAITSNARNLLIGANTVTTNTTGPGGVFVSRIITSPNGDIAEDRFVTKTGSFRATAPLGSPGPWIMQVVAFRAAGSPPAANIIEGGAPVE